MDQTVARTKSHDDHDAENALLDSESNTDIANIVGLSLDP
jgi:hypothetical protein